MIKRRQPKKSIKLSVDILVGRMSESNIWWIGYLPVPKHTNKLSDNQNNVKQKKEYTKRLQLDVQLFLFVIAIIFIPIPIKIRDIIRIMIETILIISKSHKSVIFFFIGIATLSYTIRNWDFDNQKIFYLKI